MTDIGTVTYEDALILWELVAEASDQTRREVFRHLYLCLDPRQAKDFLYFVIRQETDIQARLNAWRDMTCFESLAIDYLRDFVFTADLGIEIYTLADAIRLWRDVRTPEATREQQESTLAFIKERTVPQIYNVLVFAASADLCDDSLLEAC